MGNRNNGMCQTAQTLPTATLAQSAPKRGGFASSSVPRHPNASWSGAPGTRRQITDRDRRRPLQGFGGRQRVTCDPSGRRRGADEQWMSSGKVRKTSRFQRHPKPNSRPRFNKPQSAQDHLGPAPRQRPQPAGPNLRAPTCGPQAVGIRQWAPGSGPQPAARRQWARYRRSNRETRRGLRRHCGSGPEAPNNPQPPKM